MQAPVCLAIVSAPYPSWNSKQREELYMAGLFALAALLLLIFAAWRDIATRTIPDTIGLLLLAIGGSARIIQGPSDLALSLGSALLLFLLLMIAYSRDVIGGGDVKIMTAFAVGLSPLDSYRFVVATALAGGTLGIAYLLLSHWLQGTHWPRRISLLGRVAAIESWRIRRRGPLPYGVAIAAGGTFVLLHSGNF
jgi:prepilin peptidase CpaA